MPQNHIPKPSSTFSSLVAIFLLKMINMNKQQPELEVSFSYSPKSAQNGQFQPRECSLRTIPDNTSHCSSLILFVITLINSWIQVKTIMQKIILLSGQNQIVDMSRIFQNIKNCNLNCYTQWKFDEFNVKL